MNLIAKQKIEELIAETGHQLTCDDLDDINRLNDLANKLKAIEEPLVWKLLEKPIRVGNITLHPLTIGAYLWMVEMLELAEVEKPAMANAIIAYAMVHSKKPEILNDLTASRRKWLRLWAWSMTVSCSIPALERGFKKMLPNYEYDPSTAEYVETNAGRLESSYGQVVAFLTREYGATPQYWIWEESTAACQSFLDQRVADYKSESEAVEKASSKNGHAKQSVSSDTFITMKRMRELVNELRGKWQTIK